MLLLLLSTLGFAQDDTLTESGGPLTEYPVSAFGFTLQSAYSSRGVSLGCIGLEGFTARGLLRSGGEGHLCGDRDDFMGDIAGQAGLSIRPGPFFLSAMGELGLGYSDFQSVGFDDTSAWLFLKPILAGGIGFGFFGVELSGYTSVAFPLDGDDSMTISGAQLAILFGDFWPSGEVHRAAPPPHRTYYWRHRPPPPPRRR